MRLFAIIVANGSSPKQLKQLKTQKTTRQQNFHLALRVLQRNTFKKNFEK